MSRFINAESHIKRISSEDIARAIEQGQAKANTNRLNKSLILINNFEWKLIYWRILYLSKDLNIIQTFALALNEQIVDEIQTENLNKNKQYLTIAQVESFYNYRTVGVNFDLVTSDLSSRNDFLPLRLISKFEK